MTLTLVLRSVKEGTYAEMDENEGRVTRVVVQWRMAVSPRDVYPN